MDEMVLGMREIFIWLGFFIATLVVAALIWMKKRKYNK